MDGGKGTEGDGGKGTEGTGEKGLRQGGLEDIGGEVSIIRFAWLPQSAFVHDFSYYILVNGGFNSTLMF